MKYESLFSKLGLSKSATKIYSILLQLGATKAGPIVKAAGMHRMMVYDALEELKKEGLVSIASKNNVKVFSPADPDKLITKAQGLLEETEAVVDELRKSAQIPASQITVQTLVGKEGFWENLQLLTMACGRQEQKIMRIIGAGDDKQYYDALGRKYKQYAELCERLQVGKRLLTDAREQEEFNKKVVPGTDSELRTLPSNAFSPMYTRITEEYISFEIFEPEITIIQVHSPIVAKSYIDSFDYIWSQRGQRVNA